jgi:hypothetical protein
MTTVQKPARPRRAARPRRNRAANLVAASSVRPLLSSPPPQPTAAIAFDQCLAAIDLLEVTCRSLDHREIGQEQAALRCAQRAIWVAHDYLFQLRDGSDAGDAPDV